jgi:hypothetical protein
VSWLGDIIKRVEGAESVRFISVSGLPLSRGKVLEAVPATPLVADECYIDIFVESMWLPQARRLTGFYHAMAHVYSTLTVLGRTSGQITFVSTPSELAKLDAASLSKVVTESKRALGPLPWRGGDLGLEIGLFSVKERDLATPFLDMVTDVSNTAGVGFLSAAAPFIPLVRKGVDMITGAAGSASLEIGLDTTLKTPVAGYRAIIAADTSALDTSRLSVDIHDHRLLLDGGDLRKFPWMVFSIGSSLRKDDFGKIPELSAAYADFIAAIRRRKRSDAEEALSVFRTIVMTPDLIPSDAQRLVEMASAQMAQTFPGGNQSTSRPGETLTYVPVMEAMPLERPGLMSVLAEAFDHNTDLPALASLPLYAHLK